jgi:hypothetical protein
MTALGAQVVTRTGKLSSGERTELRDAIAVLLREHGIGVDHIEIVERNHFTQENQDG